MAEDTSTMEALVAGAAAGLSADLILFPLDTIKTRLQSQHGFLHSGGFRGIYSGILPTAIGSAPGGALFFLAYEGTKDILGRGLSENSSLIPFTHMTAACVAEPVSCLVRVPTEVLKQRLQTAPGTSMMTVLRHALTQDGFMGLYRGYLSTVMREVPFSFLQFPLWEFFKKQWAHHQGHKIKPWQSAVAGAVAGGMSAGFTTPLDVAKTRIMLAESGSSVARGSIGHALTVVWREKGIRGWFAGVLPRMLWISLGGAIFLGVYDGVKDLWSRSTLQASR